MRWLRSAGGVVAAARAGRMFHLTGRVHDRRLVVFGDPELRTGDARPALRSCECNIDSVLRTDPAFVARMLRGEILRVRSS